MDTFPHSTVFSCKVQYWQNNALKFLEKSGLGKMLDGYQTVLIKPNLVENLAPPITTPVGMVQKVAEYLLDHLSSSKILIGEGCSATDYDTHHAFSELGYTELSEKLHIRLVDLNHEKLCRKTNPDCGRWPEMYLPELLDNVFLLSMPQLKAHSLSGVTLTMKNMMGCVPPCHYRRGGAWNKAAFHTNLQEAIFDLNRYRTPDFTLLDASIGMAQAHLWGPQCTPPVGIIAASADPVAIDGYGTTLLGKDFRVIDHIAMANGVLGNADTFKVIPVP